MAEQPTQQQQPSDDDDPCPSSSTQPPEPASLPASCSTNSLCSAVEGSGGSGAVPTTAPLVDVDMDAQPGAAPPPSSAQPLAMVASRLAALQRQQAITLQQLLSLRLEQLR